MINKRLPSSPTGASPEAKKQDSRTSPPSQRVHEQVDENNTNKLTINPKYWYTDDNINTYVTSVIKHRLGGFEDDVSDAKCSFLLKNQLGKNNDLYYILYSGAVDSAEKSIPLDFFLDKSKQPEPDYGKRDDRRDVFDELNPLMQGKAKILLPYNITQTHWLTGEIIIEKKSGLSERLCKYDIRISPSLIDMCDSYTLLQGNCQMKLRLVFLYLIYFIFNSSFKSLIVFVILYSKSFL